MIIYITGEHSFGDIDPELVADQEQWKIDHGLRGRMLSFYYLQKIEAQKVIFGFYETREKC